MISLNFPVHTTESAPEHSQPALQQLQAAFGMIPSVAGAMATSPVRLDPQDVDRFIAAGFGKDHALEVIAIVAASTITNYAAGITKTPLDEPFQAHAWAG
jgi:hypothetical protein